MNQLSFETFYDFAFPRVYRFALKRCAARREVSVVSDGSEGDSDADPARCESAEVRRLCRLILERAFAEGLEAASPIRITRGSDHNLLDAHRVGFWLFGIAKQTADELDAEAFDSAGAPRRPDSLA